MTGKRGDAGADPMRFKPQLSEMVGDDAPDEAAGKGEIYQAPKMAEQHFEERPTRAAKEKRREVPCHIDPERLVPLAIACDALLMCVM